MGERPGVLDPTVGVRVQDSARPEALLELGVLRVVGVFRFVRGIEMVEGAEELVEAMRCRQVLVEVSQMVLAELAGHVAVWLEQVGKCRIFRLHAFLRAGQTNLQQTRPIGRTAR